MKRSAINIADMIRNQIDLIAATGMGLLFLNAENVFDTLNSMGLDAGSMTGFPKKKNGAKYVDIYQSLLKNRSDPQNNIDYIASQFMAIISFVGDGLKTSNYFNKSPELEFFRHIRNAISHGNLFHLLNGEPRRPAYFNNITITSNLDGKCALFETVAAGDLIELLEEIEKQLRSLKTP